VRERRLSLRHGLEYLGRARVELVDLQRQPRLDVGQRPRRFGQRVQVSERAQDQAVGQVDAEHGDAHVTLSAMATAASSEPTPQRLAAIRDQLTLLADYL